MKAGMGMFLAGAVAVYFLDPASGRNRRTWLTSRLQPITQLVRRARKRAADSDTLAQVQQSTRPMVEQALHSSVAAVQNGTARASSTVADTVAQARSNLSHGTSGSDAQPSIAPSDLAPTRVPDPIPESDPNDPTLVARVESELFRDSDVPKGSLSIDAANGVVTLRGTVKDQSLATDIAERTQAIDGVTQVVNLLHTR
jgi:hypothetical protein